MKKIFAGLFLVVFFCGCSPQLRTLMDLSSEQAAQKKYIDSQKAKFKSLLRDINNKKLKLGLSSAEIVGLYGEPIALKNAQGQKVFLYRQPLGFPPQEKAYLIFDQKDNLSSFEVVDKNIPAKN